MDDFLCPYCFEPIAHDTVHFRSSRVLTDPSGILPEDYDPYDDGSVNKFIERYKGADKEQRLKALKEWKRFAPREDPKYKEFWERHGGQTTEVDSRSKFSGVVGYNRPIIIPSSAEDRAYLYDQDGGGDVFVRDADGMVIRVEFKGDRKQCSERVCPHCHNPLPHEYGKFPIKFVSVIGRQGSGKTVFLSQLLKKMESYAVKVGLSASVKNEASRYFFERANVVKAGKPLPSPTAVERFQQPLFYNLARRENGDIRTDTFVLYDVAGEVFEDRELIAEYAPFIEHADGLIMLIDPTDLNAAKSLSEDGDSMSGPKNVLNQIHSIIYGGESTKRCPTPFAICITKTDAPEAQQIFEEDWLNYLKNDVHEIFDSNGYPRTVFNAVGYAPIAQYLNEYIKNKEKVFNQELLTNYENYAFFAMTALGSEVTEGGVPVGPILPRRIEEPLLWLFYRLGFIGIEGEYPIPNPDPIKCPNCHHDDEVEELHGDDRYGVERWGPFGLFTRRCMFKYVCNQCGHKWWPDEEQQ